MLAISIQTSDNQTELNLVNKPQGKIFRKQAHLDLIFLTSFSCAILHICAENHSVFSFMIFQHFLKKHWLFYHIYKTLFWIVMNLSMIVYFWDSLKNPLFITWRCCIESHLSSSCCSMSCWIPFSTNNL